MLEIVDEEGRRKAPSTMEEAAILPGDGVSVEKHYRREGEVWSAALHSNDQELSSWKY